jgi:hypothetical protein
MEQRKGRPDYLLGVGSPELFDGWSLSTGEYHRPGTDVLEKLEDAYKGPDRLEKTTLIILEACGTIAPREILAESEIEELRKIEYDLAKIRQWETQEPLGTLTSAILRGDIGYRLSRLENPRDRAENAVTLAVCLQKRLSYTQEQLLKTMSFKGSTTRAEAAYGYRKIPALNMVRGVRGHIGNLTAARAESTLLIMAAWENNIDLSDII